MNYGQPAAAMILISSIMTTINTIEDLIRLLDENPQWTEALRARLLTRDLIELPEKFAQFVDATTQKFAEMEANMDRRFDRVEANINSIRDDLGILKGAPCRKFSPVQQPATSQRIWDSTWYRS